MVTEICINVFRVAWGGMGNNVYLTETITWGCGYLHQQQANVPLFSGLEYFFFVAFNTALLVFVNKKKKTYSA